MTKINLLFVIHNLEIGGSETLVFNLARKFNKDNFNIHICCIDAGGVLEKEFTRLNIPLFFLKRSGKGFDLSTIYKLSRIIKENKIKIINTHHLAPLMYTFPAAVFSGNVPIVHTEHSYLYLRNSRKLLRIARFILNRINIVIGVCEDVSSYLKDQIRVNPKKLITIINGIDIDAFKPVNEQRKNSIKIKLGFEKDDFIITTIGRLASVKNHSVLLYALQKALTINSHLRLMIVGDGELRNYLENLGNRVRITDRLKFLGFRRDIEDILQITNILVQPSLSEGLSFTIIEAMAAYKAIIATDVGGNNSLIKNGETGILVPAQDIKALVDNIIDLAKDNEKRISLGEKAFEHVKNKYSINYVASQYEKTFLNILRGK